MSGNRVTLIPKAKSSKCSARRLRPASTCSRSSGNFICHPNFPKRSCAKRSGSRKKSARASSKAAKICGENLWLPSTPTTLGISMTPFRLTKPTAAGASGFTLPTWPLTSHREARRRGNSVYLPDRVIPMLPERLSNQICSLQPGVDRLTHSVFIQFDRRGVARSARFTRSVIRSAHRLTYKEAHAILTSPRRDRLGERLQIAWQLAALLRRRRFEQGALDLDFPEAKVWLDEQGYPVKLERVENDESHQLIEEFMLAANEAVARELKRRGIPTIYRIHESPDP